MDWSHYKTVGLITVDGVDYDVTHLRDRKYQLTIPAENKNPQADFVLLVQLAVIALAKVDDPEGEGLLGGSFKEAVDFIATHEGEVAP